MNDDPFGDMALRTEICRYLADWRSIEASPAQVLVTAGSGDALETCLRTVANAGDAIALEDPGYPPLAAFATSLGLRPRWLGRDDDGVRTPQEASPAEAARLAVLTPSSQFPLGGAMPRARRNAFLEWADRNGSWIIEDDYDSEFRYAGRPIPALASLDRSGRTFYVGSFSKIFSAGLRIGFVVIPPDLLADVTGTLRRYGSKASLAPQRPLAEFMADGSFYRHIRRVRRVYAERRARLLDLLDDHLGGIATFDDHRAGMHIAVRLPQDLPDLEIAAAAAEHGLTCPALSGYSSAGEPVNGLLLGFCSFTAEEMQPAMAVLRRIVGSRSRS